MFNTFEVKKFEDYNDFYVQSEIMLLYVISKSSKYIFLNSYDPDLIHFYSASEAVWIEALKKTKIELNYQQISIYY